jgi:hypothetical protein
MHLITIAVRAMASCPQCLNDTFARTIAETARCSSCSATVRMDWWRNESLMMVCIQQLLCWPEATPFDENRDDGFTIRTGRVKTACACGVALDASTLGAAAQSGVFTCSCGRVTPLREADAAVRAVFPALKLVTERFSTTRDGATTHALSCDACGGALAPKDTEDRARCSYCGAVNLITMPTARANPTPFLLLIDADDPSLAGLKVMNRSIVR